MVAKTRARSAGCGAKATPTRSWTADRGGRAGGSEGSRARDALAARLHGLRSALDNDDGPSAIGAAKELVESAAKIVLEAAGAPVPASANPSQLYRQALSAAGHPEPPPRGAAVARLAAGLVSGVAELRNRVGVAHGVNAPRDAPTPDAHLAARAALAAVHFLLAERGQAAS